MRCGIGLAPGVLLDELLAGRLHIGEDACADTGEDGHAECRAFLRLNRLDFAAVHVCEHLAPDTALAAAATLTFISRRMSKQSSSE